MWMKQIEMALLALFAGAAVSAGTFAFLIVVGVLPRMLRKSNLAKHTIAIENVLILGIACGEIFSVFDWQPVWQNVNAMSIGKIFGTLLCMLYGVSAGVFVGCIAVALAEILDTFPILFRRSHIKRGLPWVIGTMAVGKAVGALYYFWLGYGIIS